MKHTNRKGFTIVELVIVIAVIAILAAVLIPTFASVTNAARTSAAQQQAKAGLDSVLALTNGVLPDGTLFVVTDQKTVAKIDADYKFQYTGNSLKQVEKATAPETYATNEYAIYVSASCWIPTNNGNADSATTAAANLEATQALLNKVLSGFTIPPAKTTETFNSADGCFKATKKEGDVTKKLSIFYTTDIQSTQIIFVGNNTPAATYNVTISGDYTVAPTTVTQNVAATITITKTGDPATKPALAKVTVTVGGTHVTVADVGDYAYNDTTGVLTIAAAKVTGAIEITIDDQ